MAEDVYYTQIDGNLTKYLGCHWDSPFIYAQGFAEWGPGQLDDEVDLGDWIVAPGDPKILFDIPYQLKYDAAIASLGIDLYQFQQLDGSIGYAY